MTSVLLPSSLGMERMPDRLETTAVEDVTAVRLDQVCDDCCGDLARPVVLLKVDAQGMDLSVVRSAGDRLTAVTAVLLEVAVSSALYQGAPAIAEAVAALESAGFHLSAGARLGRGADLRVVELDCLFCRALA